MLTLQTVYPYGLNDRFGDEYMTEKESGVVCKKFSPVHCLYKSPDYNYSKIKPDSSFLKQNFVKILTTQKMLAVLFVFLSNPLQKSFLKHVCNGVYDFLSRKVDSFPNQQWYEMTLDLIESRIYNAAASKTTKTKPNQTTLLRLNFVNKGMDIININE